MTIFEKKVAGALLAAGAISPEQAKSLDSTPQNPKESFEVLLTRAFKVDSQKLLAAKSAASEVPAQSIGNAIVPPEVLREIPSEAALSTKWCHSQNRGRALWLEW